MRYYLPQMWEKYHQAVKKLAQELKPDKQVAVLLGASAAHLESELKSVNCDILIRKFEPAINNPTYFNDIEAVATEFPDCQVVVVEDYSLTGKKVNVILENTGASVIVVAGISKTFPENPRAKLLMDDQDMSIMLDASRRTPAQNRRR